MASASTILGEQSDASTTISQRNEIRISEETYSQSISECVTRNMLKDRAERFDATYVDGERWEKELINIVGLNLGVDTDVVNIRVTTPSPIQSSDQPVYNMKVHTIRHGRLDGFPLVLLHGYGGTGMQFVNMLKILGQYYQVFCLDILGMGLSERFAFDLKDRNKIIQFFVESVEGWRKEMGIERMAIGGHSLGGWFSAHYALQYPEKVWSLELMSPLGFASKTDEQLEEEYRKLLRNENWMGKIVERIKKQVWKAKITPSRIFKTKIIGSFVFNQMMKGRLNIPENQRNFVKQFSSCVYSYKLNTEGILYDLFHFPKSYSKIGIEQIYLKGNVYQGKPLNFYINFYFGDSDWMNRTGSIAIVESGYFKATLTIIQDSGHQMTFQKPAQVAEKMINNLKEIMNTTEMM